MLVSVEPRSQEAGAREAELQVTVCTYPEPDQKQPKDTVGSQLEGVQPQHNLEAGA